MSCDMWLQAGLKDSIEAFIKAAYGQALSPIAIEVSSTPDSTQNVGCTKRPQTV